MIVFVLLVNMRKRERQRERERAEPAVLCHVSDVTSKLQRETKKCINSNTISK